jgi:hypothetical protein
MSYTYTYLTAPFNSPLTNTEVTACQYAINYNPQLSSGQYFAYVNLSWVYSSTPYVKYVNSTGDSPPNPDIYYYTYFNDIINVPTIGLSLPYTNSSIPSIYGGSSGSIPNVAVVVLDSIDTSSDPLDIEVSTNYNPPPTPTGSYQPITSSAYTTTIQTSTVYFEYANPSQANGLSLTSNSFTYNPGSTTTATIIIDWSTPEYNGGYTISGYTLMINSSDIVISFTVLNGNLTVGSITGTRTSISSSNISITVTPPISTLSTTDGTIYFYSVAILLPIDAEETYIINSYSIESTTTSSYLSTATSTLSPPISFENIYMDPSEVTNLTAVLGNFRCPASSVNLTINWTEPSMNGGYPISSYILTLEGVTINFLFAITIEYQINTDGTISDTVITGTTSPDHLVTVSNSINTELIPKIYSSIITLPLENQTKYTITHYSITSTTASTVSLYNENDILTTSDSNLLKTSDSNLLKTSDSNLLKTSGMYSSTTLGQNAPILINNMTSSNNQKIKITTYPNPIVAGSPATIIYSNNNYTPILNAVYFLKNQLGYKVSSNFVGTQNGSIFTFDNVVLTAGLNILSIYNKTNNTIGPHFNENAIRFDLPTVCFKEGTKILCRQKPEDKYIPIERLTDNLYVKTYKHGYKKIKYILKSQLLNSSEKTINKLYRLKKTNNNRLLEDLYVTGSHAILKDSLSEKENRRMDNLLDTFKEVEYNRMIDDKYKLIACFDESFEEIDEDGMYSIYHLVLESKDSFQNYGIYANGLLAESTDELTLHKMTDFSIINYGNKNDAEFDIKKSYYAKNYKILSKIQKVSGQYDVELVMKKKQFLELEREKKEIEEKREKEKIVTNKTYKKLARRHSNTYKRH